eukprot:m.141628 g.141628  ORF g.141628 m.141628 type:complete len:1348 (-) comp16133_c0_seq1:154-4197(-)
MSKKGGKRPKSSVNAEPTIEEAPPFYYPFFSKADLAEERWNETSGKGKEKGSWPYIDANDVPYLPPSLFETSLATKRPSELLNSDVTLSVLDPRRFEKVLVAPVQADMEQHYLRKKQLKFAPQSEEPWVALTDCNAHLLHSSLIRDILTAMTVLQREPNADTPHHQRPWQLIYPQDTNGRPEYNHGGKYVVRLYWMGAWRKITVDDTIPIKEESWLLPCTPFAGELWLTIITKAILKLASLCYNPRPGCSEASDLDVMTLLTGWMPESHDVKQNRHCVLEELHQHCAPISLSHELVADRAEPSISTENVDMPVPPEEPKSRKSTASRAPSARAVSRLPSARGTSRGSAPSTAGNSDVPRPAVIAETNTLLVTAKFCHAPELGFDQSQSHQVRVLQCVPITPNVRPGASPDFQNPDDWIIVIESPLVHWKGPLSLDGLDAWTPTVQAAMATSKDRMRRYFEEALAYRKHARAPFKSYLKASDFLAHFESWQVYQKPLKTQHCALLQQLATTELVAKHALGQHERTFCGEFDAMDRQSKTPFYLTVDSQEDIIVYLHFAVTPTRASQAVTKRLNQCGESEDEVAQCLQPQYGVLLVQDLSPFELYVDDKPRAVLRTASATGTALMLEAGRYILKLNIHTPNGAAVAAYSNKELAIVCQTQALAMLVQPCARLQQMAADVGQTMNALCGGHLAKGATLEDHSAATYSAKKALQVAIKKLKQGHSLASNHLEAGHHALRWTLKEALADKWEASEPAWEKMVAHIMRWVRQCYSRDDRLPTPPTTSTPTSDVEVRVESVQEDEQSAEQSAEQANEDSSTTASVEEVGAAGGEPLPVESPVALEELDEQAVTVVQASVRGFLARKKLDQARESEAKLSREAVSASWQAIKVNMLDFGVLLLRRFFELSPDMLARSPFVREEQQLTMLQDIGGTIDSSTISAWTPFYCTHFQAPEAVHAVLQLQVDRTNSSNSIKDQPVFGLYLYDHSTGQKLSDLSGQLQHHFIPSERGYTLVAAYASQKQFEGLNWRIRCLSYPKFQTLDPASTPGYTEAASGPMQSAQPLLFEFQLTPSSPSQVVHVDFHLENMDAASTTLELSVYDEVGVLVESHRGHGVAAIPLLSITENKTMEENQSDRFCVVKGKVLDFVEPSSDAASGKSRSARGKGRGRPTEPSWHLVVSSTAAVKLVEDKRQQEKIEQQIRGWEAAEPGRRAKGQAARAKFESSEGIDDTSHLLPAKPDFNKSVVTEQTLASREQAKIKTIRDFKANREVDEALRQKEQETRTLTNSEHVSTFAKHRATAQIKMAQADRLRSAYKKRLLAEREKERQQQQLILLQEDSVDNSASKDKGKKGKKK